MSDLSKLFSVECPMTEAIVNQKIDKNSKILITGGSGVVGLHLRAALLQSGVPTENIICTYFSRNIDQLRSIFTGIKFIKYSDLKELDDGIFDLIIHCATYGQPLLYSKMPLETLTLNTCDQFTLLKKLAPSGAYGFISSSDVYAGNLNFPLKESELGISDPWSERACYFEGKRSGEAIVNAAISAGYNAKAFRLALGFGAGFSVDDQRVLYQFVKSAQLSKIIEMRDAGRAMRTYGSLVDCSRLILMGLLGGRSNVYNIGGRERCSILELAQIIGGIANVEVIPGPDEPISDVLKAAPNEVWLDISRVLQEFPIALETLDRGLDRVFQWSEYLNKREGAV